MYNNSDVIIYERDTMVALLITIAVIVLIAMYKLIWKAFVLLLKAALWLCCLFFSIITWPFKKLFHCIGAR